MCRGTFAFNGVVFSGVCYLAGSNAVTNVAFSGVQGIFKLNIGKLGQDYMEIVICSLKKWIKNVEKNENK